MIEVSVQPSRIAAGRQARLAIRFTNTSDGPCSDIVFRFELPSGITLVEGRSKVEIRSIPAGGTQIHEITVDPSKSGEFELTSGNFSYRDQYGVSAYRADFRWKLSVAGGQSDRPTSPRPMPRPAVKLEDPNGRLSIGEWSELKVLVRNTSDVVLGDVAMAVSGPLRTNGRHARVEQLRPGSAARFTFNVIADEGGRMLVGARTTFSYPDGFGSIRQAAQDDDLPVMAFREPARAPAPVPVPVKESVGTILYLSACPRDMEPLRTEEELKEVTKELQLSLDRDSFHLQWCPAVGGVDISRALGRYRPKIVHFSGHGERDGSLYVEDEKGYSELATPDGLADLFGGYSATINCVIVNACHSMKLAEAMVEHIDYVVGMRCAIGDQAAIVFSVGFYQGLFEGLSVPDAFKKGRSLVRMKPAMKSEFQTPVLLVRGGG